jgi:Ankyrin repeats (many copies)
MRHSDLVAYLATQGVNIAGRDARGRTLLFDAMDAATVGSLIERGVPIDAVDSGGDTALGADIMTYHTQAAVALVNGGANVRAGSRSLLQAAAHARQSSVLQLLVAKGIDVNSRDAEGRTALHWAAHSNLVWDARFLVEQGADLNAQDMEGATPLHVAAEDGSSQVIAYLLEKHANAALRDKQGRLPMDRAKSEAVRASLHVEPRLWDAPLTAADAHACTEVARRAQESSLGHIAVFGEPATTARDQHDNWTFIDHIPTRFQIAASGDTYILGSNPGPVYLSRVGEDGVEHVVCEFARVLETDPPGYRVLQAGERLPGDLGTPAHR